MSVRAFIFDIGGVLLNYDLDALAGMIARESEEIRQQIQGLRWHPSLIEVETGRISGEAYFERYIQPLAPHWAYEDLVQAWADVFTLNPEGDRLFRELRSRDYPVYMLSNLAVFNAVAIERKFPGFFDRPTGRFFSFELGCVKPQPEIYLKVCAAIGAEPGECMFLDDTLECVRGARQVGMKASHFAKERTEAIRREVADAIGAPLPR